MGTVYNWLDEIPDEVIKEAFNTASEVKFSARPNNSIYYRQIAFGNLGWWLPLTRVLPIIGITPQMLRPVFNPQQKVVKHKFSFLRKLFGLNQYKKLEVELPQEINDYVQLGFFPLHEIPFLELARIFKKPVVVLREDGGTGEHYYLFTAHPDGTITKDEEI